MSTKIKVGLKVQTNAAFARKFPTLGQWSGSVVRENSTIKNSWHVRVDGMEKLQSVHSSYLEPAR